MERGTGGGPSISFDSGPQNYISEMDTFSCTNCQFMDDAWSLKSLRPGLQIYRCYYNGSCTCMWLLERAFKRLHRTRGRRGSYCRNAQLAHSFENQTKYCSGHGLSSRNGSPGPEI